jgi:hypothetical protein
MVPLSAGDCPEAALLQIRNQLANLARHTFESAISWTCPPVHISLAHGGMAITRGFETRLALGFGAGEQCPNGAVDGERRNPGDRSESREFHPVPDSDRCVGWSRDRDHLNGSGDNRNGGWDPAVEPDVDAEVTRLQRLGGFARCESQGQGRALHCAELKKIAEGERRFGVRLQGESVLEDFDVVREAGGARRCLTREFKGVRIGRDLRIEFARADETKLGPLISGVEWIAENPL